MGINSGARRLFVSLICVFMAFLLLSSSFPARALASAAEPGPGEISVTKQWEGVQQPPESVTVHLLENGAPISSLSLTAADAAEDGTWQGSFKNVPLYDGEGRPISYTVREEAPAGYVSSVTQQPSAAALDVTGFGEKVTPASGKSYSIGASKLVVANKGGEYYIWTLDSLSQPEKRQLLAAVNTAGLQGLGKDLTESNTEFAAGLPAGFADGVSLRQSGEAVYIEFGETNVWSLFYAGDYERSESRGAVIVNRAETSPPTETPGPTQPPSPTEPPKTGDSGSGFALLILAAAALGLTAVWRRLRRI